jgi:hypothetical protein
MYETVLFLHSWLRWLALVAGIGATVAAVSSRPRTGEVGDGWGRTFMITLDVQLLLGLLLYVALSPVTAAIFDDFGAAMGDSVARFWAMEHLTLMLGAVVLAHLGRVLARKARTPGSRRVRQIVCYGLATIAMIVAIPWPTLRAGRELFRGIF